MTEQLLIGLLFAAIISTFSYLTQLLTFGGSVAQFVLGFVLLGLGGWQWTVPMLVFFLTSSLISRFGKRRRAKAESLFEKSSRRDAMQVFANGGVAGIITLMWFFTRNDSLYVVYLGSIAAATADTWGTEIGTLSSVQPRLITSWKEVESGKSGGVTLLGFAAGLLGGLTIGISGQVELVAVAFIAIAGLFGSVVDSFAGATLQSQFRCVVCGALTERDVHCGTATHFLSGFRWIRNDSVNLICTIVGAVSAFLICGLIR